MQEAGYGHLLGVEGGMQMNLLTFRNCVARVFQGYKFAFFK